MVWDQTRISHTRELNTLHIGFPATAKRYIVLFRTTAKRIHSPGLCLRMVGTISGPVFQKSMEECAVWKTRKPWTYRWTYFPGTPPIDSFAEMRSIVHSICFAPATATGKVRCAHAFLKTRKRRRKTPFFNIACVRLCVCQPPRTLILRCDLDWELIQHRRIYARIACPKSFRPSCARRRRQRRHRVSQIRGRIRPITGQPVALWRRKKRNL